jgi:glyoxylase-like metal-dependent hydrolase (beta-lactamase superfamily II)
LVKRLEEMGGVSTLFLTHKDDVGDHERFAEHFGCKRVLHAGDASGALRDVEQLLEGEEPVALADDLLVIPVPGHTLGSCCLLVDDRFLFSGDHVAWSARLEHVYAFRTACWYDWDVQIASMERLAHHAFEWILPGHGRRCRFPPKAMPGQMQRCLDWMRSV